MDQDTAMELVKKGAAILLLDVPQHTLVGIDMQIFSVGPIFKGIKMIPPGPHFIYYSSSNREGNEFSPVVGFFVITSFSQVIVRKWYKQEERMVKLSEEEEARYCAAVKHLEFDNQLGPYPLENFGKWKNLSTFISKDAVEHIEPIGGEITIASEPELIKEIPKEDQTRNIDTRNDKSAKFGEELVKQRCYYTFIPRVIKHKDASHEELTALNLDKSQLLEMIVKNSFGGSEDLLLGELQFTFVAFLMGQSLEAFYQWKAIACLLFSCSEAPLDSRSQLFTKFIRVIYYQIKYGCRDEKTSCDGLDKGFSLFLDDSWLSKDTFLYHACKEFISLVQEATVIDGDLLAWTKKLKKLLEASFGWDFRDSITDTIYEEDDEFSPVVVPSTDIGLHDCEFPLL